VKDIYKVLEITDYSDNYYWITAVNEVPFDNPYPSYQAVRVGVNTSQVVYNPKVKQHNEIQFSSPQDTTMVNCEMSYLDGNGKVHLYDYLFAVPSSGDPSKFKTYTVNYDDVLRIHRVFKNRHQGVDPKEQLWNECKRTRRSRQVVASSHIAFPFLSWPFRAPVPKTPKSPKEEGDGTSSSSSEKSGTNTPITPFSPSPDSSFSKVDVDISKLPATTAAVDLAVSLILSRGSSATVDSPTEEKHWQAHALNTDRDGEPPSENEAAVSAKKQNQSKDGPLKTVGIEKKAVTFNVTVQARKRYFGIHGCKAVEKGLPGSSCLRTCWSFSETTGDFQQTVVSGLLTGKTPSQDQAHPFDIIVHEGNAECKAYQAKPYTPGHLSQYLRSGSVAEINKFWLASRLSEAELAVDEAANLAVALWRWHQMCLKVKELRIFGGFVAPRLSSKEREQSVSEHRTVQVDLSIRKEDPSENNLKGKGSGSPLHHWNWFSQPVYCKTYTPPEVSLWASYHGLKPKYRAESRQGVVMSQALKFVDPYFYHGPPEHLSQKGAKLREAVIGLVDKVYAPFGVWMYDCFDFDETVPRSSEEFPGWVNSNRQIPQDSQILDPQDDENVTRDNNDSYPRESNIYETWRRLEALDLASENKPMPESNTKPPRWVESLDLAWDKPWPEFEDLATDIIMATAQALNRAEQSAPGSSEESEGPNKVVDGQSGPVLNVLEQSASSNLEGNEEPNEVVNGQSEPVLNVSEQSAADGLGWNEEPNEVVNGQSEPVLNVSEQSAADGLGWNERPTEVMDKQSEPVPDVSDEPQSVSSGVAAAVGEVLNEQSGPAPYDLEQSASDSSEKDAATGRISDEQSGPERQTTASAVAGEVQDRSYSDFLDASFTDEDLAQSTPPSQGASSVSANANNSPTPPRRPLFKNERANAVTLSLARGDPQEEIRARLRRACETSPPTDRPHVHNSEDEDSINNTHTWPSRQVPTANPKLAQYTETSDEEEEDLDASKLDQSNLGQAPGQVAQGGLPSGAHSSIIFCRLQARTTPSSTPPVTSNPSESDFEDFEDDITFAGSADGTAPAHETLNPSSPIASGESHVENLQNEESPDLLDPNEYESNASRIPSPDGFGMAATTYSGPPSWQTSSYKDRAGAVHHSSRNLMALSSADIDHILAEIRQILSRHAEPNTPRKAPTGKPSNLGEGNKVVDGASAKDEDGSVQPADSTEDTVVKSTEKTEETDQVFEDDEAQSDSSWLEHMAERGAVENAADEDLPAPTSQEVPRAVDNKPIEDEAPQSDPSWLDYQEARGVSDAVFDNQVLREVVEWAAEEAVQREPSSESFFGSWALRSARWLKDCRSLFHVEESS